MYFLFMIFIRYSQKKISEKYILYIHFILEQICRNLCSFCTFKDDKKSMWLDLLMCEVMRNKLLTWNGHLCHRWLLLRLLWTIPSFSLFLHIFKNCNKKVRLLKCVLFMYILLLCIAACVHTLNVNFNLLFHALYVDLFLHIHCHWMRLPWPCAKNEKPTKSVHFVT